MYFCSWCGLAVLICVNCFFNGWIYRTGFRRNLQRSSPGKSPAIQHSLRHRGLFFNPRAHLPSHSPTQVNLTATLGVFHLAAEVEGVGVRGEGEMHMTLWSSLLPSLNRQLQFITYTNTLFHPSTADTGKPTRRLLPARMSTP